MGKEMVFFKIMLLVVVIVPLETMCGCPLVKGIYLMHGGYCLPEYTVISDIALTADNPLHCVLAGSSGTGGGGGGQWTGPDNTAVQCGGSGSGPFTCSQSSDPTNITLYKKTGASFSGKQLYTCTISGQSISVQIESNTVLLAIYIEPPADVRSVPQNYTIHCITTGQNTSSITVGLFLEKHGNTYYDQPHLPSPVSGYNQTPPFLSTLNSATHTYDYSEEVVWRADRVEVDSTEFSEQGLTKYNGDHDWACGVNTVGGGYDDLQTYIRAPNSTTNLTVLHKNATSVTISWTAVDATETDGYVVSISTSSDEPLNSIMLDNINVTHYTLGGLQFNSYNIEVRAYQDLLGPAGTPLDVTIEAYILPLNWSLLSNGNYGSVTYRVDCITSYIDHSEYIHWKVNGQDIELPATGVRNNSSEQLNEHDLTYRHTLTVDGSINETKNFICEATILGNRLNQSITIRGPSGPPQSVEVDIVSVANISVTWYPPAGGADKYKYVIRDTNGLVDEKTVNAMMNVEQQQTTLHKQLIQGTIYIFTIRAYINFPSASSSPVALLFDVPLKVTSLSAAHSMKSPSISVTWDHPGGYSRVSMYHVGYTPLCSNAHSTVYLNTTNTNITIMGANMSSPYLIMVQAANALGLGQQVNVTAKGIVSPDTAPTDVVVTMIGSTSISVHWKELSCQLRHSQFLEFVILASEVGGGVPIEYRIPGNQSSTVLTGLKPNTTYTIMVAISNSNGTGPYSAPVIATTLISTSGAMDITILVYSSAAGLLVLSVPITVLVAIVCAVKWRQYQNSIKPKLIEGISIEYRSANALDEMELSTAAYQCIDDISDLQPPDNDENADKHTKLSIEVYEDFPTLSRASRRYMVVEFNHHIQPTNPVKVESLPEHVATYHSNSHKKFKDEYRQLYTGDKKSVSIGFCDKNILRNRFRNITVYDNNRIKLEPIPGCSDCQDDFINASYIDGYSSPMKFIAAQGPLKHTVIDFWRLIWQEAPQYIVVVTKLKESNATKCERYWPMENSSQMYGPFKVTTLSKAILPDITRRRLKLELREVCIEITQYHFTSWPDHGVPEMTGPIVALHKMVMSGWKKEGGPILVHCSAGVGRTGTFITIDLALEQAEKEGVVDIAGIVNRLREQRMQMVQTEGQYMFVHDVIVEVAVCGVTAIETNKLDSLMSQLKKKNTHMGKSNLHAQFQVLENITPLPKKICTRTATSFPEKNRSNNYLPSEFYRVALVDEYPNYIHANFVKGYREKKTFIIAQSPMENTVRDFWKMIVDYKVPAVVMLCSLKESNTETCYCYWPQGESQEHFGEFTVKLISMTKQGWFVIRELVVSNEGTEWEVAQYEVKDWPADCQVRQPATILSVMNSVITRRQSMGHGPVVVHCSDTVGRSGMYCAIHNAVEQCKAEGVVDVFQTVKGVRMHKPGAVSTVEQYANTYEVVKAFIDLNNYYQNIIT